MFHTKAIAIGLLSILCAGIYSASHAQRVQADLEDAQVQAQASLMLIGPLVDSPVIVVGADATASERYAADELAWHLKEMTGQAIDVVDDGGVPDGARTIAIGRSRLTDAYDVEPLGVEQYIIDIRHDGMAIVGGRKPPIVNEARQETWTFDRGTLYGVYEFLEQLGVRWYRPEPWGWHIPKMDAIELPVAKKVSDAPDFIARTALMPHSLPQDPEDSKRQAVLEEQMHIWMVRQRLNGPLHPAFRELSLDPRYGGVFSAEFSHAHARIVSPERYGEDHPEYFALINGQRNNPGAGHLTQLCLGNPELQDVFTQNLIEIVRANPQVYSIAVDPEDGTQLGRRMCTCPLCVAMDDPAKPTLMTNRVFKFTNIIAKKLAEAVPDAKIGLYAYSMHTEPPTLFDSIEPNILVALANINASYGDWTKKLLDPKSVQNANFVRLVREWAKVAQNKLWMREYSVYGWLGPVPMYHILQDRVQSYRMLGFEGFDWPGDPNWGPQLLVLYLKSQLQWNPDLDLDKELALFYKNYYGPAAEPMKVYHETWMNAFEKANIGSGMNGGISSGGRGVAMICTPELMAKLGDAIAGAKEQVAGQELYERRLKGDEIGYEISLRISQILQTKMDEGVPTALSESDTVKYLKSEKAEAMWRDFLAWLPEANSGDLHLHVRVNDGSAQELYYMKVDVLTNQRYSMWNEHALLRAQGFRKMQSSGN